MRMQRTAKRSSSSSRRVVVGAIAAAAAAALGSSHAAYGQTVGTWASGVTGNWSTTGASGWTNGVVPNAIGDIASYDTTGTTSSPTLTQNIAGGVTVGTITVGGTTDRSLLIT